MIMSEHMNISVNGQSKVPPGFRFHPTEEELLHYYLKKKISVQKIDLDVIHEVDLNKLEPWDIQERCKIGTTTQTDWYFFSHKDKKYPSGSRTNRATTVGFWKATGRDKVIYGTSSGQKIIGMRKTLVFYTGRAPHGQKSDWIMYEYRLHDSCSTIHEDQYVTLGDLQQEDGWVVCRIFKKRNHNIQHKTHIDHPNILNTFTNCTEDLSRDEDTKVDDNINNNVNVFDESYEYSYQQPCTCTMAQGGADGGGSDVMKWTAVDQLVACQLNGQIGDHDQGCFDPNPTFFTTVLDHHRHHQEMQLQTLTSLASQCSYSQICSLWD